MAISPQQLTIYLYSAHRAVIFAIAQLSYIIKTTGPVNEIGETCLATSSLSLGDSDLRSLLAVGVSFLLQSLTPHRRPVGRRQVMDIKVIQIQMINGVF